MVFQVVQVDVNGEESVGRHDCFNVGNVARISQLFLATLNNLFFDSQLSASILLGSSHRGIELSVLGNKFV